MEGSESRLHFCPIVQHHSSPCCWRCIAFPAERPILERYLAHSHGHEVNAHVRNTKWCLCIAQKVSKLQWSVLVCDLFGSRWFGFWRCRRSRYIFGLYESTDNSSKTGNIREQLVASASRRMRRWMPTRKQWGRTFGWIKSWHVGWIIECSGSINLSSLSKCTDINKSLQGHRPIV